MRILEKVIFDTNILRNTEPKTFLGGRDELKKFSKVAEIIFPDIVIEELKHQKRKQLEKHKKSFLENPFHWLRNINQQDTENFDNESHITELEHKEDIKYSVIKLQDYSVLEQIKELAIKKLPPFENNEGTDKGFKDTYIYFTILEYLQTVTDKYIFVCTKDGKFKEALEKHPNIKVIKDFEEFRKESISSFYDEYFINKLKETVNIDVTEENIADFWISINGNQILLIEMEDEKFVIEVDSGEIIGFKNTNEYESDINNLIHSGNFGDTHTTIRKLKKYTNFFSDEEIKNMIEAIFDNYEIKGAMMHGVKDFYWELFETKKDILERDLKEKMENLFIPRPKWQL